MRKPLIVRGARQVGKTTSIEEFGKSFKQFIHLNLETPENKGLFEKEKGIDDLVRSIFLSQSARIDEKDTLLFIDEIQESPIAMKSLRYFHEKYPHLYVIAAGSLLEHAIDSFKNYPVGRVEYLLVHPMNFIEFLRGMQREDMIEIIESEIIPEYAHDIIKPLFHEYALVGGMPQIVQEYITHGDITQLSSIYESILKGYQEDSEKYASRGVESKLIRYLIAHAPTMIQERLTFQNINNTNYKSREVGESLRSLEKARLVSLIYPCTSTEVPSLPDMKKRPRLQFLDTGLCVFAMGLNLAMIGIGDLSDVIRGRLIEHLIGQELLSIHNSTLYKNRFWVRQKSTDAEVDFIYQHGLQLIPIEVKSGATGKMRSLMEYMDRCDHHYAVRVYGGVYKIHEAQTPKGKRFELMNLPYYLGTQIPRYIEQFVAAY